MIPDWSLEDWNDAPERSQADTLDMLAGASPGVRTTRPRPDAAED